MPVRKLGAGQVGCGTSLVAAPCLELRMVTVRREQEKNLRSALHSALIVTVIHVPGH